jgi:transformation/transcription domain-associated protein
LLNRCAKELNQWDVVLEYSNSKAGAYPFGVLEASWRVPNWPMAKEALAQVELGCPKELAWKVHLYRGYLAVCFSEDQNLPLVERFVESAQSLCIKEWKRLPQLVAPVHVPLLQAAQQVIKETNVFTYKIG